MRKLQHDSVYVSGDGKYMSFFEFFLDSLNAAVASTMAPTEREIKIIALGRILKCQTSYIEEVATKERELEEMKSKGTGQLLEPHTLKNAEVILQETRDLIPLADYKIKEIAADLRSIVKGDRNDVIDRLLAEADQIGTE